MKNVLCPACSKPISTWKLMTDASLASWFKCSECKTKLDLKGWPPIWSVALVLLAIMFTVSGYLLIKKQFNASFIFLIAYFIIVTLMAVIVTLYMCKKGTLIIKGE